MTSSTGKKAGGMNDVFAGIRDFIIVVLLMVASAGGGYWYGVHEKFAPVEYVPANTPGAVVPAGAKQPEQKPENQQQQQPSEQKK